MRVKKCRSVNKLVVVILLISYKWTDELRNCNETIILKTLDICQFTEKNSLANKSQHKSKFSFGNVYTLGLSKVLGTIKI